MMLYLIKFTACSALLLAAYHFLLEKETNHKFKRFYLLFSLLFSICIPLVSIEQHAEVPLVQQLMQNDLHEDLIVNPVPIAEEIHSLNWLRILTAAYSIVALYFAVIFFKNSFSIATSIRLSTKIPQQKYTLVLCDPLRSPYSFLNYLFLDRKEYLAQKTEKEIIRHEEAHILQMHSIDIILIELLKIIFWINPILAFYKKAVQTNHEYLADQHVLEAYPDLSVYQNLLLNKITGTQMQQLTSSFDYITTKNRLLMMTRTTSTKLALSKQLILIPIGICMALIFSNTTSAQENPIQEKAKIMPSNKEGLSDADMKYYKELEDQYRGKKKGSAIVDFAFDLITDEHKAIFKKLFLQMSDAQKLQTTVAFIPSPKPLAPTKLSALQLSQFKNEHAYGVWIDDKKVENKVLNNYEPTDFKQAFISKLYGKAKEGKKYKYQVDLMTKQKYEDYLAKASKEKYWMVTQNFYSKTGPFKRKNL